MTSFISEALTIFSGPKPLTKPVELSLTSLPF